MCGRYYISTEDHSDLMQNILAELGRRWPNQPARTGEIAPSQLAPALYQLPKQKQKLSGVGLFRWGFPGFSGSQLVINARSETAAQKSMFAQAVWTGRLLLPATAFFEWKKVKGQAKADKIRFSLVDQQDFFMAGLARLFPDESWPRFVILTAAANSSVRPVHERMPLIISQSDVKDWLFDDEAALQLLTEPVGIQLQATPSEA